MSLIRLENVTKHYDPDLILDTISVSIEHGDRIGLIGRNGTGKTTLIKIMTGLLPNFKGKVVSAKGVRIGYLSQEPDLARDCTLRQEMLKVFDKRRVLEDKMLQLAEEMETQTTPQLLVEYARIQEQHEHLGGYDYELQINRTLSGLGFNDIDFNLPIHVLSGGQKSRATLAKLLLEKPDLLLFDEPTNHLDIKGIEWLENYLNSEYTGAALVVSHDRYFLDKVVRKVWELAEHKLKIYRGNYSKYVETKNVGKLTNERTYEKQRAFIEHEEEFIRVNIAGQRTREAQGRRKKLARLEKVEKPKPDAPTLTLNFAPKTRGGNDILRCKNVAKSFGDKVIFTNLNFEVYRGDVVGIIGANGTGKTTFLRMIIGDEPPTQGDMWVGPTLKFGYYTQELEGLNPNNTILDEIWPLRPRQTHGEVRSFLAKFLFSGDDVFRQVGTLSGGEQSRVLLAKLLLVDANVLLLDEPTNHLDIPAREALEAALADYPATLFIISHDRYLLNNLATKLVVFDGIPGGTAHLFEGTYAEYTAQQQTLPKNNNQATSKNVQGAKPSQGAPPKNKSKSKRKQKRKMKAQRLIGSN